MMPFVVRIAYSIICTQAFKIKVPARLRARLIISNLLVVVERQKRSASRTNTFTQKSHYSVYLHTHAYAHTHENLLGFMFRGA